MKLHNSWILVLVGGMGLASCDGTNSVFTEGSTSIRITEPTSEPTHATNSTGVRLGGSVSGASFVHVRNTTTGFSTEGYVNYTNGLGGWFADVPGLVPGDNVIVATADGTGSRTARDTIIVSRPLQPASLIVNGADQASSTSYWTDSTSFGASHKLALFADGSGHSTTGSALTESSGPVVSMSWSYDGAEAIVINGCASCSFQRISRISGAVADGAFNGQIETVAGAGEIALHAFQLTAGSL